MYLILKIGMFLLFLIAFVVWLWGANLLMEKIKGDLLEGKWFWSNQLSILLSIAPLFLFIYLLSGFFNLPLVILLFAAMQLSVIVAAVMWGFLGTPTPTWGARSQWAGGEFGLKHAMLVIIPLILTILIVVAYPIFAGIAYFTLSPGELTTRIFQYTLVAVIFSGYLFLLPIVIGTLVSENLDNETRTRFFVNQLSGLIPTALFLALTFWAFDIARNSIPLFQIAGIEISFSPYLMLFLIGFFVLTVLLPCLIGAERSRKWGMSLLEERKGWLTALLNILDVPTVSRYSSKLNQLLLDLNAKETALLEGDMMLAWGTQIDQGLTPDGLEVIASAYSKSRDLDPRFKYLDWHRQFEKDVKEVIWELEQKRTDSEMEKAAENWAKHFRDQEKKIAKEIEEAKQSKSRIGGGIGTIVTLIITVIVTEAAKWIWTVFSESLLK